MAVLKPKRGEVWWVDLDPALGSEIKKRRPAVVVSNDIANKVLNRIQVVLLPSNTKRVFASECLLTVKQQQCKASADQIRTISTERLGRRIGALSKNDVVGILMGIVYSIT